MDAKQTEHLYRQAAGDGDFDGSVDDSEALKHPQRGATRHYNANPMESTEMGGFVREIQGVNPGVNVKTDRDLQKIRAHQQELAKSVKSAADPDAIFANSNDLGGEANLGYQSLGKKVNVDKKDVGRSGIQNLPEDHGQL